MKYVPWIWWAVALVLLALCLSPPSHGETLTASFYGAESGRHTASGETFHANGLTAAHRTLPFGTRLKVCRGERCVSVRVTDRGPFVAGRSLDLSEGAARAIGMEKVGVARVEVTHE